jgi:hypothetical protein
MNDIPLFDDIKVGEFTIRSCTDSGVAPFCYDAKTTLNVLPALFYLKTPDELFFIKFNAENKIITVVGGREHKHKIEHTKKFLLPFFESAGISDGWYIFDGLALIAGPKYLNMDVMSWEVPDSYKASILIINRENPEYFAQSYASGFWISANLAIESLSKVMYLPDAVIEFNGEGFQCTLKLLNKYSDGKFLAAESLQPHHFEEFAKEMYKRRNEIFKQSSQVISPEKINGMLKQYDAVLYTKRSSPETTKEEKLPGGAIIISGNDTNIHKALSIPLYSIISAVREGKPITSDAPGRISVSFEHQSNPSISELYLYFGTLYVRAKAGVWFNKTEFSIKTGIPENKIVVLVNQDAEGVE